MTMGSSAQSRKRRKASAGSAGRSLTHAVLGSRCLVEQLEVRALASVTAAPAITSLTLVNAKTDKDIGVFVNGQSLDLSTLGDQFSIRAGGNTNTKSVKFELDGKPLSIDSTAPFALLGNTGTDYLPWTPTVGAHKLVIKPFPMANATGVAGLTTTVAFTVVSSPVAGVTWSDKAPASPIERTESQVIQVGSKVYVFGGYTSGEGFFPITRRSDVLDMATGTWQRIADVPDDGPVNHGALASDGRYIYLVGGQITGGYGTGTNASFRYDTQTDTWSNFISLPKVRFGGAMTLINNKLDYFGGDEPDRSTVTTTHWQLDLAKPSAGWITKKSLPLGGDHLAQVVLNNKAYLVGGEHGHHPVDLSENPSEEAPYVQHNYLFRYDPATDTFTRLPNMLIGTSHAEATTLAVNGKIFAMGGVLDANRPHDNIQVYDPITNKWSLLTTKAPYQFDGGVAGYFNGKLYFSNGYSPLPPAGGTTVGWYGTINNIGPTASLVTTGSYKEGSAVTASLTNAARSAGNTSTLKYYFSTTKAARDGSTYATASTTSSKTFTFADNGTYAVYARVIDGAGGFTDYQTSVTITNVAPTATISNTGPVNEGSPITVKLTSPIDPAGTSDTLRYFFSTDIAARNSATFASASSAGSQTFTFTDSGPHIVYARILDDDGGFTNYQTLFAVNNIAPKATLNSSGTFNEGDSVVVRLSNPVDPGSPSESLKYFFSTSLASRNAATFATASTANNQSFTFANNGSFPVYARIIDSDGGYTDYQTTVVVKNVAPTATIANSGPVDQGTPATVSLSGVVDPGSSDNFRYFFSTSQSDRNVASFATASTVNSKAFTFTDVGVYTVYARVLDNDGGYSDYQTDITVNKVIPTATIANSGPVNEGSSVTVSLTNTTPSGLGYTYRYFFSTNASARDSATYATASASQSETFTFDNNGQYTIYARILDDAGSFKDYQSVVTVNNVAPTATINNIAPVTAGGLVTVYLTNVVDPAGPSDTIRYFFTTSRASRDAATFASSSDFNSQEFTFSEAGMYVIYARISDNDGGFTDYQTAVTVNPDPNI